MRVVLHEIKMEDSESKSSGDFFSNFVEKLFFSIGQGRAGTSVMSTLTLLSWYIFVF